MFVCLCLDMQAIADEMRESKSNQLYEHLARSDLSFKINLIEGHMGAFRVKILWTQIENNSKF